MSNLAVRVLTACFVILALSSCEAARKIGSDLDKFGTNLRTQFQGKRVPVAKPEKSTRERAPHFRTKHIERDRQARISTAAPVDLEKIELVPDVKPEPMRQTALGVLLPRPAPRTAGESEDAPGYRGQKRKGVAYGEGEWRSADGHHRYVGAFRNGKFHGRGTYIWPDGERYEGDFLDGKFQGNAVWSMANGDRYSGEVRDGKLHGKGIYSSPGGERYEGDFRDGKFYGFGDWRMADGNRYVGDVRDDEFHGCGAYIWANGEYYAGEFRRDKFHGLGSYAWPDGLMKTCEWRDDAEIEGSCVEHPADGEIPARAATACFRAASWRGALPVPTGERQLAGAEGAAGRGEGEKATAAVVRGEEREEAKYEGQHRDGKPHGRGILTFANGDRYEGAFADGEIRGRGTMYLANGDVYGGDGEFDSRGYQGCGMYARANGDRYMGQFRDGRFHGRGTYEWAQGVAATCDWRNGERVVESCKAHRVTGIGQRYTGDGVCGTLTDRNVKQHKRWGR